MLEVEKDTYSARWDLGSNTGTSILGNGTSDEAKGEDDRDGLHFD